jgi:hypothetical protein
VNAEQAPKTDAISKPKPGGRQFSLLLLLLLVLVCCVVAAYWGELRRRAAAERELALMTSELSGLRMNLKFAPVPKDNSKFEKSPPRDVRIQAVPHRKGSVLEPKLGWSWKVYLPPNQGPWWLYISQGEKWLASEVRYRDGSVSGCQLKGDGEVTVDVTITRDATPESYIQVWAGDRVHAARLSDAGQTAIRGQGTVEESVTGAAQEETIDPRSARASHIQLLRWHKMIGGANGPQASEYGFSIYLVDESPKPRPMRPTAKLPP